jgi:non-specific serine/threonine protein kinase
MELLEGETFESIIERYPNGVPWAESLPLIAQLCAGICYVYNEQKIVHSDLKPSNIIVTRDKVVKILDFGIASRVREIGAPETRFDPKRWGALTPAYACMEMWSGVGADPRDDVYSLGCIVVVWGYRIRFAFAYSGYRRFAQSKPLH